MLNIKNSTSENINKIKLFTFVFIFLSVLFFMSGCSFTDKCSDITKHISSFMSAINPQTVSYNCVVDDSSNISEEGSIVLPISSDDFNKLGFNNFSMVKLNLCKNDGSSVLNDNIPVVNKKEILKKYDFAVYMPYDIKTEKQDGKVELFSREKSICDLAKINSSNFPIRVNLELIDNQTYDDVYYEQALHASNNRSDYNIDDEKYALFRADASQGMAKNFVYTSSSPIDGSLGRSKYADKAAKDAGIKSIINLVNTKEEAESMPEYFTTYYSTCKILFVPLKGDFNSSEYMKSVKEIFNFIYENNGPYLIHCKDGLDITSEINTLIELFVGSIHSSTCSDYRLPYYWYYHIDHKSYVKVDVKDYTGQVSNAVRYYAHNDINNFVYRFNRMLSNMTKLSEFDVNHYNLNRILCKYLEECGIDKNKQADIKYKLSIKRQNAEAAQE